MLKHKIKYLLFLVLAFVFFVNSQVSVSNAESVKPTGKSKVEINVHEAKYLVDDELGAKVLVTLEKDGFTYEPTSQDTSTKSFTNLPTGEFKVNITFPEGYEFSAGTTLGAGSTYMNNVYVDNGDTINVLNNAFVWQQNYTNIAKARPTGKSKVELNVHQDKKLVDDELGSKVLVTLEKDGFTYEPTSQDTARKEFTNLPTGEFKVNITFPEGYEFSAGNTLGGGSTYMNDVYVDNGGTINVLNNAFVWQQNYTNITKVRPTGNSKVQVNVHEDKYLVDDELGAKVLVTLEKDGFIYEPTSQDTARKEFTNLPAGEFKVNITFPEGYEFSAGNTLGAGSTYMNDVYVDNGGTINVLNNAFVWQQNYTNINKVEVEEPAEPTQPTGKSKVQVNVHEDKYLVDDELGAKVLVTLEKDGFTYEPTTQDTARKEFTNLPAGEFKVNITFPEGYEFSAGNTLGAGSTYMNDVYVDNGGTINVLDNAFVWQQNYTNITKVEVEEPAEPTQPTQPSEKPELEVEEKPTEITVKDNEVKTNSAKNNEKLEKEKTLTVVNNQNPNTDDNSNILVWVSLMFISLMAVVFTRYNIRKINK